MVKNKKITSKKIILASDHAGFELKENIKKYLNMSSSSFGKSKNNDTNENIVLTGNNFLGGNVIDELFPVDINEYNYDDITSEIKSEFINIPSST